MGFTLLCGGPWRRRPRPEKRADDGLVTGSQGQLRNPEPRKRETLQKKKQPPPAANPSHVDISVASGDAKPSAAELDVVSPVTASSVAIASPVDISDIPDCAELPANPPNKSEPVSPTSPSTPTSWIKQRRATLPGCPSFLVPGSTSTSTCAETQAPPWHEVASPAATAAAEQMFKAVTSESLLASTLADWQLSTATSTPGSLPSPSSSLSSSSYAGRSGSASTLSQLTLLTPTSSPATSRPAITPDGDQRPRLGQLTPIRSSPRLSVRQSSGNIDQLLARHALLETRRQILLSLHEVEQEQERIMEEWAAMPEEELARCAELSC